MAKALLLFTRGISLKTWKEKGWLDGSAGVETFNQWADFFEKFYLITYGDQKDLNFSYAFRKNVTVLPRKLKLPSPLYSLLLPFLYRRQFKEADILICMQMDGSWSALIAKILFKKKFVLRCGYQLGLSDFGPGLIGHFLKKLSYLIEWIGYHGADYIILTSHQAKDYVVRRYRIAPGKIAVISNAVDISFFKPLDVKKIQKSLIFVGRLEAEKNIFSILEALRATDYSLTICGSGTLEMELKKYSKAHHLQVRFLGDVPNAKLPEEINKHDVFIFPSFYEGNPKALIEAMSCGIPVIGTNVRGINNIIKHKQNGYLCETTSSESVRKAILEVMPNKPLRSMMGLHARQYALEHFALNQKIEKMIRIFKKILNN